MPDITPKLGDTVQVNITAKLAYKAEEAGAVLAKIGSKNPDGSYQLIVDADAPLSGTMHPDKYSWSHDLTRWTPVRNGKPAVVARQANSNQQPAAAE